MHTAGTTHLDLAIHQLIQLHIRKGITSLWGCGRGQFF